MSASHLLAARDVAAVFDAYQTGVRDTARRAARHFAEHDWIAARADSTDRLTLYGAKVNEAIARVDAVLGAGAGVAEWARVREAYAAEVETRDDREIAETFFSSASRLRFTTVGVEPSIEFHRPWAPLETRSSRQPEFLAQDRIGSEPLLIFFFKVFRRDLA